MKVHPLLVFLVCSWMFYKLLVHMNKNFPTYLSGAVRSLIAVPSARNSGLDKITNFELCVPLFRT